MRAAAARFMERFPGQILYAVKSNPLPEVLGLLSDAGVRHFDTASIAEIELVSREVPGGQSYFMHPVKDRAAIRDAYAHHGVRHLVIDHVDELHKIHQELGPVEAVVMVRVATAAGDAQFNLSGKFGAPPDTAVALLRAARGLGYRCGLCFHVGSQCTAPNAFGAALGDAGEVLAAAGVAIECLDIGGGFPSRYVGVEPPAFDAFMDAIDRGVAALDLPPECVLMCEPGRALVADGLSLVVQVRARRDGDLYINDGIYGSLGGVTVGMEFPARQVRLDGAPDADRRHFRIFGPTCDGLDVLPRLLWLADDVGEGDWIEIGQLGAYAIPLRTSFNGFYPDTFVNIARRYEWPAPPPGAAQQTP